MCTRHNILHCKAVSPSLQGETALALFSAGKIHNADRPATANPYCPKSCSGAIQLPFQYRYLEAIQTCTLLLSSLFDEAERGDSFTTRATPEVLSETVWFNDFQPT